MKKYINEMSMQMYNLSIKLGLVFEKKIMIIKRPKKYIYYMYKITTMPFKSLFHNK